MQKKYVVAAGVALVLVIVVLVIWQGVFKPVVTVAHPTKGLAVQAVYATGTVEATVMFPIAARSAARLVALNVAEGAEVKEGQVLAQLEDSDLQQTIAQLVAKEDYAKSTYTRNNALAKKHFIAQEALDRAKADMLAAGAALKQAKVEAEYLRLVAPADGRIIRRDGEVGQMIAANQPVFWLSCCAPLRISAEVDEEDIAKVHPGQEVVIRADAFPGEIFHGQVKSITPKGDPVARSYRVRVSFAGKVPLLIGMTAETNIVISKRENALLVPAGAVENNHVWLVEEGHLKHQPVKTGAVGPEQVEIIEGIRVEDVLVLKPGEKYKEGQRVRVTWAAGAAR